MGILTTSPPPQYRDDPDAVSLHTTPEDYDHENAPLLPDDPPAYDASDPQNPRPNAANLEILLRYPHVQNRMDHNTDVGISNGTPKVYESRQVIDPELDSDPKFLETVIRSFAAVPPIPLVYIMGTHCETRRKGDKRETRTITDFRIVLNIQKYLYEGFDNRNVNRMSLHTVENGEKTYRGSFMRKRACGCNRDLEVGGSKPGLTEWCHLYCASPSKLKNFRLTRTISGFNEELLKDRLEGLVRSTGYRGRISVTFPVENKYVDIYSSNKINEWRVKWWVRWAFYLTFMWIFSWPVLFFSTKRWAVVKADWAFSSIAGFRKTYATISEEEWYAKWHVGIRRLILGQYVGEVTEQQLAEAMAQPADPPMPARLPSINPILNPSRNALGALQQGFQIAGALTRGQIPGSEAGWGNDYDEY